MKSETSIKDLGYGTFLGLAIYLIIRFGLGC